MFQYSPSTNSFYPDDLLSAYEDAGTLPNDLAPISDDVFREFTATPEPGKMRVAGSDGLPAWGGYSTSHFRRTDRHCRTGTPATTDPG